MSAADASTATLLSEHGRRDPQATAQLGAMVYDELRARARRLIADAGPSLELQPTELVHDVFLKLMRGAEVDWRGRTHFYAVASRQLRHVMVDRVRAVRAQKRAGDLRRTTLDLQHLPAVDGNPVDLLELESALSRLEQANPRRCSVVVLRLFGGLRVSEVAHYLDIGETSVKNHWRLGKAWLMAEIEPRPQAP